MLSRSARGGATSREDAARARQPGSEAPEGRGPQRRPLQRARGLARVRDQRWPRASRGRSRGAGPDRARRALAPRRRGGRSAGRGRPAWRRRRLPGATRAVRGGRQRPGHARGARRPLRRPRGARRRGGDGQADLQAPLRLPRTSAGPVLRGRGGGLARAGRGDGQATVGEAVAAWVQRRHLQGLEPEAELDEAVELARATTRG